MKTLIVVNGNSGTGKSSIAKFLSEKYMIPYISKDTLKERMFDSLGVGDKQWSRKVSAAAHRVMDDIIRSQLSTEHSIIVESNFKEAIDSNRFTAIINDYAADCVQVFCEADSEVLYERWIGRIEDKKRHPGHVEDMSLDEIRNALAEPYLPLRLPGKMIRVNTTDFSSAHEALVSLPL